MNDYFSIKLSNLVDAFVKKELTSLLTHQLNAYYANTSVTVAMMELRQQEGYFMSKVFEKLQSQMPYVEETHTLPIMYSDEKQWLFFHFFREKTASALTVKLFTENFLEQDESFIQMTVVDGFYGARFCINEIPCATMEEARYCANEVFPQAMGALEIMSRENMIIESDLMQCGVVAFARTWNDEKFFSDFKGAVRAVQKMINEIT